jgi:LPXTG-site transpeptidase (sortase) family protein
MAGLEIKQKRELHLWRWFFWLVLVALLATAGWFGYQWYTTGEEPPIPLPIASADPRIDETVVPKAKVEEYTVPATHPRYISIPKLGISKVRVQQVGVTANNQLDVPKNINDTAWYEKSATPGQGYGAVLIDGHNGGITRNGVFTKLSTLQGGDEITVERGDGETFTYSVVENESMSLDEVNETGMKKMMTSADEDKEGLSLITCDGKWVPKIQQFDRRIMLRAVIVD